MDIRKGIDLNAISKIGKKEQEVLLKKIDKLLRLNHRQKLMLGILILSSGKYVVLSYIDYGLDIHLEVSGLLFLFAVLLFCSVVHMDLKLIHMKKHLLLLKPPEDDVAEHENND